MLLGRLDKPQEGYHATDGWETDSVHGSDDNNKRTSNTNISEVNVQNSASIFSWLSHEKATSEGLNKISKWQTGKENVKEEISKLKRKFRNFNVLNYPQRVSKST